MFDSFLSVLFQLFPVPSSPLDLFFTGLVFFILLMFLYLFVFKSLELAPSHDEAIKKLPKWMRVLELPVVAAFVMSMILVLTYAAVLFFIYVLDTLGYSVFIIFSVSNFISALHDVLVIILSDLITTSKYRGALNFYMYALMPITFPLIVSTIINSFTLKKLGRVMTWRETARIFVMGAVVMLLMGLVFSNWVASTDWN